MFGTTSHHKHPRIGESYRAILLWQRHNKNRLQYSNKIKIIAVGNELVFLPQRHQRCYSIVPMQANVAGIVPFRGIPRLHSYIRRTVRLVSVRVSGRMRSCTPLKNFVEEQRPLRLARASLVAVAHLGFAKYRWTPGRATRIIVHCEPACHQTRISADLSNKSRGRLFKKSAGVAPSHADALYHDLFFISQIEQVVACAVGPDTSFEQVNFGLCQW